MHPDTQTHAHTRKMYTTKHADRRKERRQCRAGKEMEDNKKMQGIARGDNRTGGEIEIWVMRKIKEIKSDK